MVTYCALTYICIHMLLLIYIHISSLKMTLKKIVFLRDAYVEIVLKIFCLTRRKNSLKLVLMSEISGSTHLFSANITTYFQYELRGLKYPLNWCIIMRNFCLDLLKKIKLQINKKKMLRKTTG